MENKYKKFVTETKHFYWKIELKRGEYSDKKHEILIIYANSIEKAEIYFKEIAHDLGYHIKEGYDKDKKGNCKNCGAIIYFENPEWKYSISPLNIIYHIN